LPLTALPTASNTRAALADPKVTLPADIREDVEKYILNRVRACVEACRDRNDWFTEMDNQLRGRGYSATRQPFGQSSLAEDPITREHHTTVTAGFNSNIRSGDKYWQVEATDPQDEEGAMAVEAYLTVKPYEWGLPKHIYDAAYDAVRFPVAWMAARWKQEYTTEFSTGWVDAKGKPVADYERLGNEKQVTLLTESVVYEGIEYRVPDPRDVYLDPPNAPSHQESAGMIERMNQTSHDLLLGIEAYGYDYDAITDMLDGGATSHGGADWLTDLDEREGVKPDQDDYWECYQYIGKLPVLLDPVTGEFRVPPHLWNVDFVWMVCPRAKGKNGQGCVFKFAQLPYEMRPYVPFHMLKTPRRQQGECVPSLLKPIQEELTVLMRWGINSATWGATPGWFVDKTQKRDFGRLKRYPGCVIDIDMAGGLKPEPIPNDVAAMGTSLELGNALNTRAANMVAGQSLQLQPKVRKTGEIQADQQNISSKFDLYFSNFTQGLEDLAVLTMSIAAQHADENGTLVRVGEANAVKVTPQDLRRRYRYIPHANSENGNPTVRIAKWQAIMQAVMSSPLFAQQVQAGDMTMAWNLLRRFLEVNNERNVTGTIGPEPPPGPDPAFIMQKAVQAIGQLIQTLQKQAQANPMAAQIAQALTQIVQNAMQEGQQAAAQQGNQDQQANGMGGGMGNGAGGGGLPFGIAANPHDMLSVNVGPSGFIASPFRSLNQTSSGAPGGLMNGVGQ
jgi:hypothetical protein